MQALLQAGPSGREPAPPEKRFLITFTCALAFGFAVSTAKADQIYINSALTSVASIGTRAFGADYRLANTNFDQRLNNGGSEAVGANSITARLGNVAALNLVLYDLALEHRAGEGLLFSLTKEGPTTTTLAWGTFAPPVPGSVATINGVAPGTAFNSLYIEARGRINEGNSMAFSDMAFASSTLTLADGAFLAGSVTPTTGGSVASSILGYTLGNGFFGQRLLADDDLALYDWTLTAKIVGAKLLNPGGDELVSFRISGEHVAASIVPEPSTLALLGAGLAAGAAALMRRRRAR